MLDLDFTETCQSGLMYLFAKEAGFNRPRWSESSRLRIKIKYGKQPYYAKSSQKRIYGKSY